MLEIPSNDLARLTHRLAPTRYQASAVAPDDYVTLQTRTEHDGILTVWNGASTEAIYGPAGNVAFRAWHDSLHLRHTLTFSASDEYHVADIQAAQSGRLGRYIYADTAGQVAYYERWGRFPTRQIAYVLAFLTNQESALARGDW